MCQQTAMIPATKHAPRAPISCTVALIGNVTLHVHVAIAPSPHERYAANISTEEVTTNKLVDCEGNMSETRRESENRRDSSDDFSMHPILKLLRGEPSAGKGATSSWLQLQL